MAEINKENFSALKGEMEDAFRKELEEQSSKGKGFRRAASISIWLFTLIIGAALGAYFKDMVTWFKLAML